MTINQALKLKNKLVKSLSETWKRIEDNNSFLNGNHFSYDVVQLMKEYSNQMLNLADIKAAIQKANVPVLNSIYELGELKTIITRLREMDTTHGLKVDYGGVPREYIAQIDSLKRDQLIKNFEDRLETIQAILEEFNATTHIEQLALR